MRREAVAEIMLVFLLIGILRTTLNVRLVASWSNGGYSADPSNPDYGTHDWIAQYALDWLPTYERQYILDNLAAYLYGTELPDNRGASDGIGDTAKHHIYYWSDGSLQDDASAVRASEEYYEALNFLKLGDFAAATKTAGIMSHYIVDMAVFGHVMGAGTEWGSETHHSDYENHVNQQTSSYDAEFNLYLSFDDELRIISAYNAAKELAYDTTFDVDGVLTCVWMDENYDWANPTFKDRAGESLNLAVNYLTDVLHTLYLEAAQLKPVVFSVPVDGLEFNVVVDSNSIISDFNFRKDEKEISFNVTGPDGTLGFCNVTVPMDLMKGEPWRIRIDNTYEPETVSVSDNGTHTILYFTYTHTTHNIKIRGTWVVPEFPTWTPILLMLFLLTIAIAIRKRRLLKAPIQ